MVKLVTWEDDDDAIPLPLCQKALNFRQVTVTVKTTTEEIIKAMLSFRMPEYILYDNQQTDDSTVIRMIFAHANVPYELRDVDLSEFDDLPFFPLPILEMNGMQLGDVGTICRHLAWRYDLSGHTSSEDAVVDMAAAAIEQAKKRLAKWIRIAEYRELDDLHMDELEEQARRYVVQFLGPAFEEMLRRQGGKWIAGNDITWADLSLAALFNPIIYHRPSFFDRLPLLYNHCRRVADMQCSEGLLYNIRERSFKHVQTEMSQEFVTPIQSVKSGFWPSSRPSWTPSSSGFSSQIHTYY